MNLTRFLAILNARNTEFWRDRAALAWNIAFPVLIVLGFAFAFSDDRLDLYKVGVIGVASTELPGSDFLDTDYIQFIPIDEAATAIVKVERHQLDMLLDMPAQRFWINRTVRWRAYARR